MGRRIGAGVLIVVTVVVILAVAAIPLVLVYRSSCPDGDGRSTRYSLVLPWNDPPAECRNHQQGIEVVRDELGL